jgi:FAD/FMN-containing dehydrogenase
MFQMYASVVQSETVFADDFSKLCRTSVQEVVTPKSVVELQNVLKTTKGPIAIAGARCSMGGQTIVKNGTIIDMRCMNKISAFDSVKKTITVQAGARWRDVQTYIDPHNLSVKVMQSYCDFSIGGSLSVNVHGRYIGYGPLIETVQSIKIVLADGSLVCASRTQNKDLFKSALGGYGLLGIIVEVTLSLTDNTKMESKKVYMNVDSYFEYLSKIVLKDTSVVLHNGNLFPPCYDSVMSTTWYATEKELTINDRLQKSNGTVMQKTGLALARRLPFLKKIRGNYEVSSLATEVVCWRNYEAGYRVSQLQLPEFFSTTLLQEYFIPLNRCKEFVTAMRAVLQAYNPNILNISIRHVKANDESLLSWSSKECCAFVLYYEQSKSEGSLQDAALWAQQLIDVALQCQGTYYLPYQLYARKDQFRRAYPHYKQFEAIKLLYDPNVRFQNSLWQAYF